MVAGHSQRVPGGGHAHHQPEHPRGVRAPVHQVAQEHRGAARGRDRADRLARQVPGDLVAEPPEQGFQLGAAAVHVADHVERAGAVPVVGEQPAPLDDRRVDLGGPAQHVHLAEPLPAERTQGPAQPVLLTPHDMLAERPLRTGLVPLRRGFLAGIEHDGDRQDVV